jgi:rhamnosyl/mannosyltransferase
VVAVGRLVPYKGLDVLIEALAGLDATAMIVGDGAQAMRLRRLVVARGLADRVIFTGSISRERLRVLLHAARVFAFPSLTAKETFGIAQLEAMAAGLPIVNTALPSGVPTIARHGIEALTVPPGDPARLAEAIRHLLDSPGLAASLGRAGKARAMAEYDQSLFIDRMHALYAESLVARRLAATVASVEKSASLYVAPARRFF